MPGNICRYSRSPLEVRCTGSMIYLMPFHKLLNSVFLLPAIPPILVPGFLAEAAHHRADEPEGIAIGHCF